jgi:hypothetical protein
MNSSFACRAALRSFRLRDLRGRNARHIAPVTAIEACRRRRPRQSGVTEASFLFGGPSKAKNSPLGRASHANRARKRPVPKFGLALLGGMASSTCRARSLRVCWPISLPPRLGKLYPRTAKQREAQEHVATARLRQMLHRKHPPGPGRLRVKSHRATCGPFGSKSPEANGEVLAR